jgi:hypothetical protein
MTMDPFSISVGCVSLSDSIAKTTCSIASFIKTACAAKDELAQFSQQLIELKQILDLIENDIGPNSGAMSIQEDQREVAFSLINRCLQAVEDLDAVIAAHEKPFGSVIWATNGKKKVQALSQILQSSIGRLKLILETITG